MSDFVRSISPDTLIVIISATMAAFVAIQVTSVLCYVHNYRYRHWQAITAGVVAGVTIGLIIERVLFLLVDAHRLAQ